MIWPWHFQIAFHHILIFCNGRICVDPVQELHFSFRSVVHIYLGLNSTCRIICSALHVNIIQDICFYFNCLHDLASTWRRLKIFFWLSLFILSMGVQKNHQEARFFFLFNFSPFVCLNYSEGAYFSLPLKR